MSASATRHYLPLVLYASNTARTNQILAVLLLFVLHTTTVSSGGNLLLKLISFNNPTGVDASGTCCDNFFKSSNCFDSCDHQFHLCFKKNPSDQNCTLHEVMTDSISSNTIEFGDKITNVSNPIQIKFDEWKSTFELRIDVSDHDDNDNDPIGSIDYTFRSDQRLKEENITKEPFSIHFRIEISCGINYYGTDCSIFCLPTDMCYCEESGKLSCPTLAITTNVLKTSELIEPVLANQFLSTDTGRTTRLNPETTTEFNIASSRLREEDTDYNMRPPPEFDDVTTRASVPTTLQRNTAWEQPRTVQARTFQTRIPTTSNDGSTVILNCAHVAQFSYKEYQFKIRPFEDINMFTIELSIKDENSHVAYLLFNTIGGIFPPNKCLLEILMLTQDLDIRNESREVLVKYVARFNGTGFYLPLSSEEMVLKPLTNYSAELFYAPSEPIEQQLPIVSKRITRLMVIIIGSCALFVIFTLLMLGMYFLCQIKKLQNPAKDRSGIYVKYQVYRRGHYNLGRTYSYAIEDIKGMQETDTRINSAETSIELKDMHDDHHIIPYENGF